MTEMGYKCNMPDISAAIGLVQLRKQDRWREHRADIAKRYDQAFSDLLSTGIIWLPNHVDPDRDVVHAHHFYPVLLNPERWRVDRDQVVRAILAENVGVGVHYLPVHQHPYYVERYRYQPDDFPVASRIGRQILSLPLAASMQQQDIVDVIEAFRKVVSGYTR
jgi:dTDP-4-amino-4,6-dideoxygalactose transaminase